ncbi:hypothetical protein CYG49_01300 [Candidatus Saccharibacteria bacterium]|nr:MAG: hypothetical protein CYG49_01300 [Candidatus Saccharibacteria bacterium]
MHSDPILVNIVSWMFLGLAILAALLVRRSARQKDAFNVALTVGAMVFFIIAIPVVNGAAILELQCSESTCGVGAPNYWTMLAAILYSCGAFTWIAVALTKLRRSVRQKNIIDTSVHSATAVFLLMTIALAYLLALLPAA